MLTHIRITNAREHNLRKVSLTLPRDKLIVITGLSGSGKSTLAFDTLYAEGQRRYIESLSAYARQFLDMMRKPDVDAIEGLSPAIAIEQKTTSRNPRSTVGTVTEIYDYLRLLFARAGTAYSPATGKPIAAQSVRQIADRLRTQHANKKLFILAPIVRGRKGEHRKRLQELLAQGYQRVRIDKHVYELDVLLSDKSPTPLNTLIDRKRNHDIDIVIDRVVMKDADESRLADSIETALNLADGIMYAVDMDTGDETAFSSRFCCPVSGFTIDEIEPRLFSFNSPQGACRACDGLGTMRVFDIERIIPDTQRSLQDGAVKVWHDTALGKYNTPLMLQAAQDNGIDIADPLAIPQRTTPHVVATRRRQQTQNRLHRYHAVAETTIPARRVLGARRTQPLHE